MNTPSADNFDDFAEDYRQVHNKNLQILGGDSYYFAKAKVQYIKKHEKVTGLNILDVGCGDGTTAGFMAELFPGCSITGIDISAESISKANSKKINGAIFSLYDGHHFPFAENYFDLVFIAGVLHHVNPAVQITITEETYRVLKKEGRVYVFEHNPVNPATQYLVKTCPFDKYARLIKSPRVKSMLSAANFRKLEIRYTTFFPRNRYFSLLHGAEKYLSWCPLGAQYYVAAVK